MGKKREERRAKREDAKEKPVFGSGADVETPLKGDGFVKCVCTVACAWNGYHDEGDRVFVKKELLEGDPFFKAHFKAVDGVVADAEQNGEAAEGEGEAAEGEGEAAEGEGEAADGEDGQGELGLK